MKYRNVSNKSLLVPQGIDIILLPPGEEIELNIRLFNEYLLEIHEPKLKVYIQENEDGGSKARSKKIR